jgi:glucose/arabinose dehydrogenase
MTAAAALALTAPSLAQAPQRVATEKATFTLEAVASGLQNAWALGFLPDGRMIVTEKPGRVRIVSVDGKLSEPLGGVPRVDGRGQGGLLDIALDPQFAANRRIYLSFSEPRENGRNGTSVARGALNAAGTALENVSVIWRQEPSYTNNMHFGSRLVFGRDGHLFVMVGDRYALRDEAQNPQNTLGKVIRITTDGIPAPGNPAASGAKWKPEIWSIGHRNVQGAALHPATGRLWTAEHGARGGDEINQPQAGRNYGWPVITYGVDYSGAKIGEGTQKPGMEQPVFYWDPSIAPSGMAFYTGDAFPAWKGSAFVGALAGKLVSRLEFDGDRIVREERMLQSLGERIRDVRQGPDGLLYLVTDGPQGRVLRLKPAA